MRAAIDSEELASELADTGLLGSSEMDGMVCLYWPSESWSPAILGPLRQFLRERGVSVDDSTLSMSVVPDQDWNSLWAQSVGPIRIGSRFLIRQSWNPVETEAGLIELIIDPKRAFGTGFHATTQLIIEWLEGAVLGNERILDIGTGSGVLAMAAVRLGAAFALGIDSDPEAIDCALENAAANGFGAELEFRLADAGRLDPASYDIVVANLDRNTLLHFAREISRAVGRQGRLCLSGIQEDQISDISLAFSDQGGRVVGQWQREEWLALEIRFSS